MRAKLSEWLSRYLPLELASILTALTGGTIAAQLSTDPILIAYAATWSENLGYYGLAFTRELRRQALDDPTTATPHRAMIAAKALAWEFGLAELLDSIIVRPLAMLASISLLGHLQGGIIAGKLLADAVFYAIAIFFYERGKRPP